MPFSTLKLTFLGTGTSSGVPMIGCDCTVCRSEDPRDKRLRCAVLISFNGKNIVIDTGPDFRQQMLRAKVNDIAAVLFTHDHNDHTAGLDDVRPLNFKHQRSMPLYATPSVQKTLTERYAYAFGENTYPGAPRLVFETITKDEKFTIEGLEVQPIEVHHGKNLPILGFRFGDLTYITDCKSIEKIELEKVKGTKTLILNALHHNEHHSHMNLAQALKLVEMLQPERAYLTHISHNMGKYEAVNATLPPNVALAFDGLVL